MSRWNRCYSGSTDRHANVTSSRVGPVYPLCAACSHNWGTLPTKKTQRHEINLPSLTRLRQAVRCYGDVTSSTKKHTSDCRNERGAHCPAESAKTSPRVLRRGLEHVG
jgi:hypothetical protein